MLGCSAAKQLDSKNAHKDQGTMNTPSLSPIPLSPIPLVVQLTGALDRAGIVYCHWKSNVAIERAESGETDLDLLVARNQAREFNQLLNKCGFVAAERKRPPHTPGVVDFFGYDATADRFVHVHAHYQLVLGHDRTKNYHLPIEEPFLASASTKRVFPTPSPEFEYVVFVIRMVLKYAILDEILWNALRGRRAQLKQSEREELDHLNGVIDSAHVATILREVLPFIDADLFTAAEEVVVGRTAVWRRVAVARRMQSTLEAHSRSVRSVDAMLRITRRVISAARRRVGSRSGYRLTTGGAIVAIMGGDGAGKSTALREIGTWLESHFDTIHVHLGKPPWSWTTYVVRGSLKVIHIVTSAFRRRTGSSAEGLEGDGRNPGYRRSLWFACKARDRYLAYRKARRSANQGAIILSDRFPHPALRLMDAPQIARLTAGSPPSWFVGRLIRLENRYHRRIGLPDVAIVLRLDPEEAARRKTDESYDYVVKRSTEVWEHDWTNSSVHVVDASKTPHAVVAELKDLIWASLA